MKKKSEYFVPVEGQEYVFKGVFWDDGWEFDAPCVLYSPLCRYGDGGNSGHLESMVEDVCIDVCLAGRVRADWRLSDINEFRWRGWSPKGFPRRKGTHVRIPVKFYRNAEGELDFQMGEPAREHK